MFGAVALVSALGVGLGLGLPALAVSPLKDGHGTATFTWHDIPTADKYKVTWHQPFTGKVEGLAVKGTASEKVTQSNGTIDIAFDVSGTAAGTNFSLVIRPVGHLDVNGSGVVTGNLHESVSGHFGTLTVSGTITLSGNKPKIVEAVKGTVGAYRVAGRIMDPVHHGKVTTVSTTFTVSGG